MRDAGPGRDDADPIYLVGPEVWHIAPLAFFLSGILWAMIGLVMTLVFDLL